MRWEYGRIHVHSVEYTVKDVFSLLDQNEQLVHMKYISISVWI